MTTPRKPPPYGENENWRKRIPPSCDICPVIFLIVLITVCSALYDYYLRGV